MARRKKGDSPFGRDLEDESALEDTVDETPSRAPLTPATAVPQAPPKAATDSTVARAVVAAETVAAGPRRFVVRNSKAVSFKGAMTTVHKGTIVDVDEWGAKNVETLRGQGVELDPI